MKLYMNAYHFGDILPLADERNSHGMESLLSLRLENKISDTVNERYGHGQINRFIL